MTEVHSFGNLPVIAHAWNKDRTQIAVSLGKNDLRIYNKQAGKWKLTHTLCEHLSRVLAIDWAPKTNRIVTASADYNAYVWTFENDTWKPQMVELQRTSRAVCCAKWSPDENKFAIGSSDKNVGICYYETEQRFWAAEMIKKKPKSTVTCLAWHPNNQLIAVGSLDYRVRIYSGYVKAVDNKAETSAWGKITNTGELLHEFPCESGWTHDVAFSPSGENLAWVSHNSIIFAVSSNNPSKTTMEITNYLPFRCIIFVSESTIIVAGHEFSPLIYNYDERKGTIEFVEKLDSQETSTGRQSIGRLFDQPSMQTQTPEPVSTHQSMITQIVPYQTENTNLVKISSADLFGQVVIWNLSGRNVQQTSSLINHLEKKFHINNGTSYTNGHTKQIVPYQTENTNLVKISSADLFGQVVIWNLSGKVNLLNK
ncbi:unnamed protein product [Adineta steineri]|uniref:Arp2/3 complex 41 kDa subunit n=1 Tax=Adineta steineri TaxID=433720 RepID=A0A814X1V3_9BILA|nr:unnamed protein product [Adineta steineri]